MLRILNFSRTLLHVCFYTSLQAKLYFPLSWKEDYMSQLFFYKKSRIVIFFLGIMVYKEAYEEIYGF